MYKLRQRGRDYEGLVLRDLLGSIRHYMRPTEVAARSRENWQRPHRCPKEGNRSPIGQALSRATNGTIRMIYGISRRALG